MYGELGKLTIKTVANGNGSFSTDTNGSGVIDAVNDRVVIDCADLRNHVLFANAIAPSSTVTLVFEISYDGVGWSSAGSNATISNFTGAGVQYALPQATSGGAPLPIKQARCTCTVFTGTGSYTFGVTGYQRPGYA